MSFNIGNEITNWLTEDELARAMKAIEEGGDTCEYFFTPDCGCDGLFFPYYCGDCDTWHREWRGTYYDVIGGEWWYGEWSCDEDGDWDYMDLGPVSEMPDDHYEKQLNDALDAERGFITRGNNCKGEDA